MFKPSARSFSQAVAGIAVRLLLWVTPVFIMLRVVDRLEPLRALGLIDNWKRGVLAGMVLSALLFAASLLRFGWPHGEMRNGSWSGLLGPSLGVGFFEEIPFRGFILQKLWTRMNFWLANGLTSLVFVGVHLPGWFMLHMFALPAAANVLVLSLAWGVVFRYSRSLWSCIISHNANDFISFVLFHGQ
jgi:uncharacterized protein